MEDLNFIPTKQFIRKRKRIDIGLNEKSKNIPQQKIPNSGKYRLGTQFPSPCTSTHLAPISMACKGSESGLKMDSIKAIELELDPKTPPCTPDAPVLTRQAIDAVSNHSCRRTLSFGSENFDVEVRDNGQRTSDPIANPYYQWTKGGEISIFNMLIPIVGSKSEDFGFSVGIKNVVRESKRIFRPRIWDVGCLVSLLKDFPEIPKKMMIRRRKMSLFPTDLTSKIKVYDRQKVPRKRRSNTRTISRVPPVAIQLVIAKKNFEVDKRSQSLTSNIDQVHNAEVASLQTQVVSAKKSSKVGKRSQKLTSKPQLVFAKKSSKVGKRSQKLTSTTPAVIRKKIPRVSKKKRELILNRSFIIADDHIISLEDIDKLVGMFQSVSINDPMPKVDMDEMTLNYWNPTGENSIPDEEKEKFWKEERELYGKRAASLVAKMHCIQGNRKFSPWKGSVIDSVVGVFLTQNVSDRLSSSVFMSLISHFPPAHLANQHGWNSIMYSGQESAASHEHEEKFASTSRSSSNDGSSSNHQSDKENIEIINDGNESNMKEATNSRKKKVKVKEKKEIDWDELKRTYVPDGPRTIDSMDSVYWDAARCVTDRKFCDIIIKRGMNNILGTRIKNFLNRVLKHFGRLDLEWLRDGPEDIVNDFLSSVEGLGLKSVECVRLLSLQHHAFPVDTNVGRIAVRLGWVPLKNNVELDLLEKYPSVDAVQRYLWPRLCMLNTEQLYELHYQLITFGKAFCTKKEPNCNACPLKGECRYFASAYARRTGLRLRAQENYPKPPEILPPSQEKDLTPLEMVSVDSSFQRLAEVEVSQSPVNCDFTCGAASPREIGSVIDIEDFYADDKILSYPKDEDKVEAPPTREALKSDHGYDNCVGVSSLEAMVIIEEVDEDMEDYYTDEKTPCYPEVEYPQSPSPESENCLEQLNRDMEDFYKDPNNERTSLGFDIEEFNETVTKVLVKPGRNISKELIRVTVEPVIPTPAVKITSRLRTVHYVYQLEDRHPLLQNFDKRDPDDPCYYLFLAWPSGNSSNGVHEKNDKDLIGTIMIPCRTALRGRFPLNGTYFQVNEVFADQETTDCPIRVPRKWLYKLTRRALYCGKSTSSILKGMEQNQIQYCFWEAFMCVRGFDRRTRASMELPTMFKAPGGSAKKFKETYQYDE